MDANKTGERPAQGRLWSFARRNQATVGNALPQICTGTGSHGSQEKPLDG